MALQYFTGFEDGTLNSGTPSGSPTNAATNPRSGARHLSLLPSSSNFTIPFPTPLAAETDDVIVGAALYNEVFDVEPVMLVRFGIEAAYIALTYAPTGVVSVGSTNSTTANPIVLGTSDPGIVSLDTWQYIEMRCRFSQTVGQIEVYVDGIQVINASGLDTIIGSPSGELSRSVTFSSDDSLTNLLVDDVYLLDPTGESTPYDTFLGPVEIERLAPDGDSLTTDWTSTGANFHDQLEEVPVTSTENVHTVATASDLRMTTGNRTHTGTIFAVKPQAIAVLDLGVAAKNLAPFMRADPGGTPTDSTKTGHALAGGDTEVFNIVLQDPDTAATWTTSGLNGAELGLEVV